MNRRSLVVPTKFLQAILVLIGIGVLALLLWEPHIEGRNAHATLFEIYFKDPFLAYAYLASIPFFAALYQAFKVLGYIGRNEAFSQATAKALRTIKVCALAIIGFVAVGELFIMLGDSDDRAGGVFIGILITFGSVVVATVAAMFERILRNAVDMKSGNDFISKILLLAVLVFASNAIGAPVLPKGWILPEHPTFDGAWRKSNPSRYLKIGADLDCDGIEDSVFILQPVKGPGMGLFAFLQDGKGSYKSKLLFDSRKDGADLKGRSEKEINRVQLWYRSLFGIKVVERGIYPTACGRGYMECGKNEKRKVEMACGGIDFFPFGEGEGGNINFYWDRRSKKFMSAVMGD